MSGFLNHVAEAPGIGVADLLGERSLVVLAPHPDDETLGCGALLFDAAAGGTPCHVICVTDGARSHPASRTWPAARLAQARQDELRAAVRVLAPAATVTWLGHPDCGAPDDAEAAARIAPLVPQGALLLASWGDDPHVDHQQVARLAYRIAAARPDLALAFYPIWGRFTDLQAPALRIEATEAARAAKVHALACHRTQMTALIDDDPEGFVMTPAHQSHFLTHPEIVIAP